MSSRRAVLWDMDGTLVDSEEYHWIAWREALQRKGITITHAQFISTFGQRNDAIITQWLGTPSPDLIESIGTEKEEIYRKLVRERGIEPLPGVARLVRELHREGWLQAIASAAPRKNVEVVLEALSATHRFQAIVSAEDVQRGKPDPEVYLKAAERVEVPPAQCVVVEDAEAGIEGAKRAGMRSVGVSRDGKRLAANLVVSSLDVLEANAFEALLNGNFVPASGVTPNAFSS